MAPLRCVCIAGAGCLGASLGLAIRALPGTPGEDRPRVVAWDRDPAARDAAMALGAFDAITAFPQEEVAAADLLVAAVQGEAAALDVARRYGARLPAGATFTELSRVRGGLDLPLRALLPPQVTYAPSAPWLPRLPRPDADAFRGATVLLGAQAPALEALWADLGAQVRRVPAQDLDVLYAAHWQLPALQRAAWVTTLAELADAVGALWGLGAPDAAPLTLAALGAPDLADLQANREALLIALGRLASVTADMQTWLERADHDRLVELVRDAQAQATDLAFTGAQA
jgi:prephenate dehydrogenase